MNRWLFFCSTWGRTDSVWRKFWSFLRGFGKPSLIAECRSSVMYVYVSLPSFLLSTTETVRLTENFIDKMIFSLPLHKFCPQHFCFSNRFDSCAWHTSRPVSVFKRRPLFLSQFNRNWNIEFYCNSSVDFHEYMVFPYRGTGRQTTEKGGGAPALQIYEEAWQSWYAHFFSFLLQTFVKTYWISHTN